jgi:hypothetical protein
MTRIRGFDEPFEILDPFDSVARAHDRAGSRRVRNADTGGEIVAVRVDECLVVDRAALGRQQRFRGWIEVGQAIGLLPLGCPQPV